MTINFVMLFLALKLFKVKGEFREGHIGFSGEAPFFSCIAIATEEKLAEANEIMILLAVFRFNFKQLHYKLIAKIIQSANLSWNLIVTN